MDTEQLTREHIAQSIAVKQATTELAPLISAAGAAMADTLRNGGKLLACGNGGSASDAQHFSGELLGRFERERDGLPAVALSTDTSATLPQPVGLMKSIVMVPPMPRTRWRMLRGPMDITSSSSSPNLPPKW